MTAMGCYGRSDNYSISYYNLLETIKSRPRTHSVAMTEAPLSNSVSFAIFFGEEFLAS